MGIDAVIWVDCGRAVTSEDIARFNYRLCEAFGRGMFMSTDAGMPLRRVDSPLHKPAHDEYGDLLELEHCWRYYGEGYPRGPGNIIIAVCSFLERLTGGKALYGGDCHDYLSHFDRARREELWTYFCDNGTMGGASLGTAPCKRCAGMPIEYDLVCKEGKYGFCCCCGTYAALRADATVPEYFESEKLACGHLGIKNWPDR